MAERLFRVRMNPIMVLPPRCAQVYRDEGKACATSRQGDAHRPRGASRMSAGGIVSTHARVTRLRPVGGPRGGAAFRTTTITARASTPGLGETTGRGGSLEPPTNRTGGLEGLSSNSP